MLKTVNFLEVKKSQNLHVERVHHVLVKIDLEQSIQRCNLVKLLSLKIKVSTKEKFSGSLCKKIKLFKKKITLASDFSTAIYKVIQYWSSILRILNKNFILSQGVPSIKTIKSTGKLGGTQGILYLLAFQRSLLNLCCLI